MGRIDIQATWNALLWKIEATNFMETLSCARAHTPEAVWVADFGWCACLEPGVMYPSSYRDQPEAAGLWAEATSEPRIRAFLSTPHRDQCRMYGVGFGSMPIHT